MFQTLTMGDAVAPKPQLPPFTPPKFHWNLDNLYEQFKSFKRVIEFAFKGQYEKCSNSVKCGSILNWLGIEAYPVYDNLPPLNTGTRIVGLWFMFLRVMVRESTKSFVVTVMVESESLSIES